MTTRGVVDLVLCLDASESMRPCFEGVRRHLNDFVRGLASGGQQQEFDVRVDFLAHSCGQNGPFQASSLRYHDGLSLIRALYEPQGGTGFFTSDLPEIERALAGVQVAGDEAPLVAIDVALDYPWRPRNKCHRAMIYLTDEPFESGTGVYDAVTLQHQLAKIPDIIQKFHALGVILFLVAPRSEGYKQLSMIAKSQYKVVDQQGQGLESVDFGELLSQFGKSVSVAGLQTTEDRAVVRALFGQNRWLASSDPLTGR